MLFLALDDKRRAAIAEIDNLRAMQNKVNEEIVVIKKQKGDAADKISQMREVSNQIKSKEEVFRPIKEEFENSLLYFPNIPCETSPVGGEEANKIVKEWGEKRQFSFKPKDHIELAQKHDIMDFQRAAKLTGSGFALFKGDGALLERALINFMLDLHVTEHGYTEISPPFIVKSTNNDWHRTTSKNGRGYV